METLYVILFALLAIFGIASFLVGIWQFIIYAKLSWARRENSRSFNGIETAENILDKLGDEITVKKSFWSLTYVNYSKSSNVLKIGSIDSRRKSIWTVATTGRQAYSAHIIEKASHGEKPPISIFWFKLQTFWFGLFMSMIFNVGIFVSLGMWINSLAQESENIVNVWFAMFIIIASVVPLIYAIASFKTSRLMLLSADDIFQGIFSEEEIVQIKQLWKIEYINAIIELIKVMLILIINILKIFIASKAEKSN